MQRAILLRYHRNLDNVQGEGWLAAMVPLAIGSGLVAAGVGPTRLEAARDARARRIVNEGGTAWVREGGTDVPVDEPAVRRLDVPEAVRERAERLGSILRATRLLRGRTTMVDEPRDPFGMNVFQDAELLWRQLVAIEDWDEWVRAIRALSETDLRKIVFLHVHWHYKKQRREDEAA